MKDKKQLLEDCVEIANKNIATTTEHLFGIISYCEKLLEKYNVDENIVFISFYLMDCKICEARLLGKKNEHVKMAADYAKEFLKDYHITKHEQEKIINCIAAHHKDIPFQSLEAEIVANLDCYRFIHPYGVFSYLNFLSKKSYDIETVIRKVRAKMDEKYANISLKEVREDLEGFYFMFTKQFDSILKERE